MVIFLIKISPDCILSDNIYDTIQKQGRLMSLGCLIVPEKPLLNRLRRKTIITGHYGSGKTEFAVSLAMLLRSEEIYARSALIDLDIINPYFRSREQRELLENAGVIIYGSAFEYESTAELPALSANLRAPLEDGSCRVIVDTGGNDAGALVLNQFTKYFLDDETTVLAVVNANRPDTSDLDSAIEHIAAIEFITKLTVDAIINNTHLLHETTTADIIKGYKLCEEIFKRTGKYILCTCYPDGIADPDELTEITDNLMPLGLYMRPTWLDI